MKVECPPECFNCPYDDCVAHPDYDWFAESDEIDNDILKERYAKNKKKQSSINEYYLKNRENIIKKAKEYYQKHKEQRIKYQLERYYRNREREKEKALLRYYMKKLK